MWACVAHDGNVWKVLYACGMSSHSAEVQIIMPFRTDVIHTGDGDDVRTNLCVMQPFGALDKRWERDA